MAKEKSSWIAELYTVAERRSAIRMVILVGVGVGVAALVSRGLKKSQENSYYQNVANPSKAAFFSERLWNAFEGWHGWSGFTDEDEIWAVLNEIPDKKMFAEVQRQYKIVHGEDLLWRINDELSGDDLTETLAIIQKRGFA